MKGTRSSRRQEAGPGWALGTSEAIPGDGGDAGAAPQGPPLARLRLEKRRGKPVTVAALEGLDAAALRALGKELKTLCGSGGTVKEDAVELQGDHREALRGFLPQRGVRVKG